MLYLDNAATSYRKPVCVYRDMFLNTLYLSANAGRGGHRLSVRAAEKTAQTAQVIAELFNIENPMQIAFTQNATYALNMAIAGAAAGEHIIVTSMEHNSVLRPAAAYCKYTSVKADSGGIVNPADIERAIRHNTKLIVCTHISNVCGSIQPIEEIGNIAKKHKIAFLVDAAQSAGTADIDVKKMNISMLAFSGHKGLMGPLGTGGLYVDEGLNIAPIISGGTGSASESLAQPDFMPDMLQSGTLNTPAIAALGSGVKFILKETPSAILAHERRLALRLINELKNIDGITVYGSDDDSKRSGTLCFNIDGTDSGEVSGILNDSYSIAVRGGWHCAYPAHKTLGTEKGGSVRVSFGYFNTDKDVRVFVDAVSKLMKG